MTENEEFYDKVVAPALLNLAQECQERGMSFVACVEYAPGETGELHTLPANPGIKAQMAYWGVRAQGNVDSFMIAAERHAYKHGHSSMYLSMRGVPAIPKTEGTSQPPNSKTGTNAGVRA